MIRSAVVMAICLGMALGCIRSVAAEDKVGVTRADCRRLVAAVPAADVAYKGGVDVRGKPVVGADLPGGGNDLKLVPDVIAFTYTINPVGYGQSKALAQQSAALSKQSSGISSQQSTNYAGQVSNQKAIAAATQQKAALQQALTTLTGQTAGLTTAVRNAQTTLNANPPGSPGHAAALAAYDKAEASLTANTKAIAANNAAQTQDQAAITSGNAETTTLSQQATTLQGQQAAVASQQSATAAQQSTLAVTQGNTQMPVAAIHYDIAHNTLTINGQPIGSADEAALAEECRKRGFQ